ncbi:hypothetical protein T4E_3186 [Trichinella pseudospiralis]|uniref:Uncharacterized protein n=1 Tax=Trichinella pseudospiralis TaxID=6337 RepID=A0A0V0XEZ2_TRIPS|nr:hypothetical protein T4E_3186 [Trichinella pseudospiralis]
MVWETAPKRLETLKATGMEKVEATGQNKNHLQLLRNNGSTADNTCSLVVGGNGYGEVGIGSGETHADKLGEKSSEHNETSSFCQEGTPDRKLPCARQYTCIFFGWQHAAPDRMSDNSWYDTALGIKKLVPSCKINGIQTVVAELPQDRENDCTVSGKERQQTTRKQYLGENNSLSWKRVVIVGVIDATGLFQDNGTTLHCGKRRNLWNLKE